MKKLFLIFLLFLLPLSAHASDELAMMVVGSGSTGGGPSYVLSETFDGATDCGDASHTNCDNTWTMGGTGTLDFNYTTSPAPLQGTYSAYVDGTSGAVKYAYKNFTAISGTAYAFANINIGVMTLGIGGVSAVLGLTTASLAADLCLAGAKVVSTTNRFCVSDSAAYTCGSTITAAAGHWYLWLEYTPGTGANGTCDLYVSTTTTKPGSPEVHRATNNGTANAAALIFVGVHSAANAVVDQIIFDRLLVDEAPIGSNP